MKDLDDRLRDAGSAWRDDHRDATEPDLARITGGRRRVLLPLAAAVAVVALVVAGVLALRGTQDDELTAAGLTGPVWKLDGSGRSTFVIDRSGRLVADDECSLIGGRARIDGQRLTVTDLSDRAKGCTDTYDPYFGKIFARAVTVTVDGDRATLTGSGRTLRATKAPQLVAPTLDMPLFAETTWRLTDVRLANGARPKVAVRATFEVRGDRMRATDGCSTVTAVVDARSRVVRPTSTQLKVADCTVTGVEAALDVVQQPFRPDVRGNQMTLTSSRGKLTYVWVPKDAAAHDPSRLVGPTWRLTSVIGGVATSQATLRFPTASTYEFRSACGDMRGAAQIGLGYLDLKGVGESCRGQLSTVASFLSSSSPWRIADGRLIVGGGGSQAYAIVFAGASAPPTAKPLLGDWRLDSFERDSPGSSSGSGSSDSGAGLNITASSITVIGTCVPRRFSYVQGGGRITTKQDGAVSACAGGVAHSQDVYRAILNATLSWSVAGTTLTLRSGETTMSFSRTANPTELWDTWTLTGVEEASGSRSRDLNGNPAVKLTLTAASVVLSGTCSERTGTYSVNGDRFVIRRVNERDCLTAPGVRRLADAALAGTLNWSVREQILTLRKGTTTLTFTR